MKKLPATPGRRGPKRLGCVLEAIQGLASAQVLEHMASTLHGGDMSFSQLNAVYRMYLHGPQTIAELAQGADLSQTAASRMVERLVQAGTAERREAEHDRRRKQVELTPAGVQQMECLRRLTAASYATVLAPVPKDVLHELDAALSQVERFLKVPSPHYQTRLK